MSEDEDKLLCQIRDNTARAAANTGCIFWMMFLSIVFTILVTLMASAGHHHG